MARPAHFYEPGFPYLITSVTDHRQPLLTQNGNGRRVLNDLDFYRNQFRYQLFGYVIMPDHFHTVILPSEDDFKRFAAELLEQERAGKVHHGYDPKRPERYYLNKIMRELSRHSSYEINGAADMRGRAIWQDGFDGRVLRDADTVRRALDYLHQNPVEAKLVEQPRDWPLSSYRNIVLGDESLIRLDALAL
jgi:putative transposase